MTAIFTTDSFPGVTEAAPVGVLGSPTNAADPVSILLSDGQNVVVFASLTAALRCMEFMRQRNQYLLQASDDVAVISTGTKLILLEMTLTNQKLMSSFVLTYSGGKTLCVHRSMSLAQSLASALQSVGFAKLTAGEYTGNASLSEGSNPPRIRVVDWYFRASPSAGNPGSVLDDGQPIVYDHT